MKIKNKRNKYFLNKVTQCLRVTMKKNAKSWTGNKPGKCKTSGVDLYADCFENDFQKKHNFFIQNNNRNNNINKVL